jgi:hypothetical protein
VQKVKGGEEERDRSDTTSGCGTGQSSEEGVSNSSFLTYSIINKSRACLVYTIKKSFSIFPSPAGMLLSKLSLGGNNDVIINYSCPGRVW